MTAISGSDEKQTATSHAIRDGIDDAVAKASKTAQAAVERTKDGLDHAKATLSDAYASGKDKAVDAYSTAREKMRGAGKTATDGFDNNPLAALLGGLAIGAAIGALLPRTERETKALGAVGERVRGAAGEAIEAAKGVGRDKLDELGFSKDHARETMKSLLDGAIAAAGSAGSAAIEAAKKKS